MKLDSTLLLLRQFGESLRDLGRYGVLTSLEQSQIAAHEFTALIPVAAPRASELQDALETFAKREQEEPCVHRVPGLHTARWVPLSGLEPRNRPAAVVKPPPFALAFAFICDGNALDVLEELFVHARERFEPILERCAEYPKGAELEAWVAYFRSHRIRSNYLFRDSRQHDPHAANLHPSAREIQRALRLRKRFREFARKNQGKGAAVRREAFLRQFAPARQSYDEPGREPAVGPPYLLTAFERALDREGAWIRRSADLARTRARRDARARSRAGLSPAALRGVHAKHHGLIQARFHVRDDVPERLRRGIFIPGKEYAAWVRPSNSDAAQRADWLPDARGLAIKLAGVEGKALLEGRPIPNGLGLDGVATQDFTLVSHPTFFVKNLRDYAILRSFIDVRPDGARETLGVAAGVLAFTARRPRELGIFARTLLRWCSHPLLPTFHSLLPFLVGPDEVAKCSIAPTAATRALLARQTPVDLARDLTTDSTNYLRCALQRSLDTLGDTPLVFEFALHVARELPLPVEDPRIDWSELGERIPVATLTIGAQDATSAQRMASAEGMVMTPWHGLEAHRPLGSLNRGRLTTYLASARARWKWDDPSEDSPNPGPAAQRCSEQHPANGGSAE